MIPANIPFQGLKELVMRGDHVYDAAHEPLRLGLLANGEGVGLIAVLP